MNIHYLTRVRKHFTNDMVPRSTVRHNMRQWVAAVRRLGPQWLLASPITPEKRSA